MKKQKGFTLIELLVAISIIGILATLVMINLSGLQARGRDAQRKNSLQMIATALELYYADFGRYPTNLPAAGDALTNPARTKTYLKQTPNDPKNGGTPFAYCVNNTTTATRYNLYANLENDNDSDRFCGANNWSATTCDAQTSNCVRIGGGAVNLSDYDYTISE